MRQANAVILQLKREQQALFLHLLLLKRKLKEQEAQAAGAAEVRTHLALQLDISTDVLLLYKVKRLSPFSFLRLNLEMLSLNPNATWIQKGDTKKPHYALPASIRSLLLTLLTHFILIHLQEDASQPVL